MLATWLMLTVSAAAAPDTVVVCPPAFREALDPWVDLRRTQGHRLVFVDSRQDATNIRERIREHSRGGALRYVLLVGDADPAMGRDGRVREVSLPTHFERAAVNVQFGSEPLIATDNWYADLDGDYIPDVAVGRLTADTAAELSVMVQKIRDYENPGGRGAWCRRINVVAGVGGFGAVADATLEHVTRRFITESIPPGYATSMTYGSWRSPYCPDPREFHATTVERLNEGCLFWIYVGHGQRTYLDQVRVPGAAYHILGVDDMWKLRSLSGLPIAIFLACYSGAYDDARDCLAEGMLAAPGGPVAVLAGSRVTMPYSMSVLADAMMDEYFRLRQPTLGDVVLGAKRRMVANEGSDSVGTNRRMLDLLAAALSPSRRMLDAERREHLSIYNLLGDPLLRIQRPASLEVHAPARVKPGEVISVETECEFAGRALVEFVGFSHRAGLRAEARASYDATDESLTRYTPAYRQANNHVWVAKEMEVEPGRLRAELVVPDDAAGPCAVRVVLEGQADVAIGAATVRIEPPADRDPFAEPTIDR